MYTDSDIVCKSKAHETLMWCCSTLLQRGSAAVPTGFVVFIVAWVMLLVVAFGFPYSTDYSKGFVALFSLPLDHTWQGHQRPGICNYR